MCDSIALGLTIWNYCRLGQEPRPAELLFIFGCHNLRVAERAASLYHQGYAPRILVSGGWGAITRSLWQAPEARVFQKRLVELSVPEGAILLEERSSTVRDNITFSQRVLEENGVSPASFLLVTQPFAERRVLAACQKAWHTAQLTVTSPQISFENYPNEWISASDLLSLLAGEVQRLQLFSSKGWINPAAIPSDVMEASKQLAIQGFTRYLDLSLYPELTQSRIKAA